MIQLRSAQKSDAIFMTQLETLVMRSHAISLWGRHVPSPTPSLFDLENSSIVMVGQEPVGYLMVERSDDHLILRKFYLVPEFQGQGIGSAVLNNLIRDASRQSLKLRVSVLRPNIRALKFYKNHGLGLVLETAERIFLQFPAAIMPADRTL